jgi:hypothetical protein
MLQLRPDLAEKSHPFGYPELSFPQSLGNSQKNLSLNQCFEELRRTLGIYPNIIEF